MNTLIDLSEPSSITREITSEDTLTHVYLKIIDYERTREDAQFYAELYAPTGKIAHRLMFQNQIPMQVVGISGAQIQPLLQAIQTGKTNRFSRLTMFAQETSIKYANESPNYYLNLIINEPGQKITIKNSKRNVIACQACNTMLLRYSFNWIFQREDDKTALCPYCNHPLTIIKRPGKIIPIYLDYSAENLEFTPTNYQIGALYQNVSIKMTIKVLALYHFFLNLQNVSYINLLGPFDLSFSLQQNKVFINQLAISESNKPLEWRSAVLFPEDLIAF